MRAAGSIVKSNISQVAEIDASTLVKSISVEAGEAGTLIVMSLAKHLIGTALTIAERVSSEA